MASIIALRPFKYIAGHLVYLFVKFVYAVWRSLKDNLMITHASFRGLQGYNQGNLDLIMIRQINCSVKYGGHKQLWIGNQLTNNKGLQLETLY